MTITETATQPQLRSSIAPCAIPLGTVFRARIDGRYELLYRASWGCFNLRKPEQYWTGLNYSFYDVQICKDVELIVRDPLI